MIHTVGPIGEKPAQLRSAYRRSLEVAAAAGVRTLAFPSISTGVYGYPVRSAAVVATTTVRDWLLANRGSISGAAAAAGGDGDGEEGAGASSSSAATTTDGSSSSSSSAAAASSSASAFPMDRVLFCVFSPRDEAVYRDVLAEVFPLPGGDDGDDDDDDDGSHGSRRGGGGDSDDDDSDSGPRGSPRPAKMARGDGGDEPQQGQQQEKDEL